MLHYFLYNISENKPCEVFSVLSPQRNPTVRSAPHICVNIVNPIHEQHFMTE